MTDKQEKIDVYECSFYQKDRLSWCKYYPKGCNECGDLVKVGEKILMADKQIIIDGVNVSECVYRAEEKCTLKDDGCYFFPNCNYKQLQRLKEHHHKTEFEASENLKKLVKLEQECEELKEELEAVYDNCKGCSTCNEALYNANLYTKKYRKLEKTLIEIKGIIEQGIKIHDDIIISKQILKKISEVLE